jgi:hypothetical protein
LRDSSLLNLVAKFGQGSDPEHSNGARAAIHGDRDLIVCCTASDAENFPWNRVSISSRASVINQAWYCTSHCVR